MIDNLSPGERKDLRKRLQAHFDSMSTADKEMHMELVHNLIRHKMVEHMGLITKEEIIKQFLNEDFPRIIKEGADDMQEEAMRTGNIGYAHLADSLRKTRWGVDKFDFTIHLVDRDEDVGVGSYEEKTASKEE